MITTDFVECEGCGAQIEHILCGDMNPAQLSHDDPDYHLCNTCISERDSHFEDLPDYES